MAKRKITAEIYSYGIYTSWDRNSRELPKILEITDKISLTPDVEFGYVIKIKGGKRQNNTIPHRSPFVCRQQRQPCPSVHGRIFYQQ